MFMLVVLIAMIAIFYFLMIRPQRRRQKEHSILVETLQKGDKVITVGGLFGVIESVGEQDVVLRVEDGSKLKFLKTSVMGREEEPQELTISDDAP